jgi:hypothetical protein
VRPGRCASLLAARALPLAALRCQYYANLWEGGKYLRHLAKTNCDSFAFLAFGKKKGQLEMAEALISVQKKRTVPGTAVKTKSSCSSACGKSLESRAAYARNS